MLVNGKHYRTSWMKGNSVFMIEQNLLPFEFEIFEAKNYLESCKAIKTMIVRGAGAIGAVAGYAMAQAFVEAPKIGFGDFVKTARKKIEATRPTAQNLFYATNRVFEAAQNSSVPSHAAISVANSIADEDAEHCRKIGEFGNALINNGAKIQTHCNAGWLAFVDYGSALSPVYEAHRSGKSVFVYVDETRPRCQGARLTAWELNNENVPHAILPDNAAAHLAANGQINLVIVGSDRIARNGDVANKIGTLEKAIIAKEFNIPFYVAAPSSTIDLKCASGKEIPIEERSQDEVIFMEGLTEAGKIERIRICAEGSPAVNPAFDVTPAKYVTGIITEKGIIEASEETILELFRE